MQPQTPLTRQPTGSLAVERPEIPEVLNLETGEYVTLNQVVGQDFSEVIRLRAEIKRAQLRGEPLFVCAECGVPVSLLMHPSSRSFYFKHTLEDGRCSGVTRGSLSHEEISARKYNGAKESRLHKRMKHLLVKSLEADSSFASIETEERWSDTLSGQWRQPDVRAVYSAPWGARIPVVFEVQLSTTFLDVIVERRDFYLRNGALLFWVFAEFPDVGRRLTQDDVFYNNNQNAFVVSEETKTASDELSELCMTCVWSEPGVGSTEGTLRRKTVSFQELTLDVPGQRAYYFDFENARSELRKAATLNLANLREEFELAWTAPERTSSDLAKLWKRLYAGVAKCGIRLRNYSGPPPTALIDALYSAKHGEVVGWRYKKFIEVAHRIATGHPSFLPIFRRALQVYMRGPQLEAEDRSRRWAERVKIYRTAMKRGDSKYAEDVQHDETLIILFPELFESSFESHVVAHA